jgi:hypothetical protein
MDLGMRRRQGGGEHRSSTAQHQLHHCLLPTALQCTSTSTVTSTTTGTVTAPAPVAVPVPVLVAVLDYYQYCTSTT